MIITSNKACYTRVNRNILVNKDIEFDALFVEPASDESLSYSDCFNRQFERDLKKGIDKLTFSLPRDYCNESFRNHFKNGAVTTRTWGNFMFIDIHREYIPHGDNLLAHCNNAIGYLLCGGAFKIPITKTTCSYNETGEQVSVKEEKFDTQQYRTFDLFSNHIRQQLKLSCIELCFDYQLPIRSYLNKEQFLGEQGTLYSPDYKVYGNGNRKKSFVCVYDKAKQLRDSKHRIMYRKQLERVEFRLYRQWHKRMFVEWENFLDTSYTGLLAKCTPVIRKQCEEMHIDFSRLCEQLPDNDTLKELIGHVEA